MRDAALFLVPIGMSDDVRAVAHSSMGIPCVLNSLYIARRVYSLSLDC